MRKQTLSRRTPSLLSLALVAACGSGTSRQSADSGPAKTGSPPDANAVPPASQFAKLCEQRGTDLAAAMCPAGDAECTSGCTYFFSASQGNDSLDGKAPAPSDASGPWQSLAKLQGLKLQAGDVLCLRRGDTFRGGAQVPYGLHAPTDKPIVIRPYGPPAAARPVVSGAKVIPPSWTVSSLSPKLMQVSLAQALTRGPAYQRQGKTYTPREKIFQLFVAGQPQRLATFPNPGEGASVVKGLKLPGGHYSLIDAVPGAGQSGTTNCPPPTPSPAPPSTGPGRAFTIARSAGSCMPSTSPPSSRARAP